MRTLAIGFTIVLLLAGLLSIPAVSAQISANPVGLAVRITDGNAVDKTLTLSNNGDQDISYRLKTSVPHQQRDGGPRRDDPHRDDPNTLSVLLLKYSGDGGYGWAGNNQWLDVFRGQDPQPRQGNIDDIGNMQLADYDVVVTGEGPAAAFYDLYERHRDQIIEYVQSGGVYCMFAGSNSMRDFHLFTDNGDITVSNYAARGDSGDVNPAFLNQNHNGLQAGIEDEFPILTPFEYYRDDNQDRNRVRVHMRGNSLNFATVNPNDLPQDGVWYYSPYQAHAAIIADWPCGSGYVLFTGITGTLFYENNWQWSSMMECVNLTKWVDGRLKPRWFALDQNNGVIHGGEQAEVTATFNPTGLDDGVYRLILQVQEGNQNELAVEMPVLLSVGVTVGSVAGTVTDAATHQPVAGVSVNVQPYGFILTTDGDGLFSRSDLPPGWYSLIFQAADYLPATIDSLEVQAGEEADGSQSLLHSECNLNPDHVNQDLAPDTDTHVQITCTNDGNGPLTYTLDRRLIGDANAAPWEDRRDFNAGTALHDDRIEGVAFDGEHFYFAGANAANPNTIYVTDRDGNETNHYTQLGASQYGMKDLEYDGELLWGAGYLQNVYGFTPEGDSVISFQTAYNPTGNIAYDSDEDLLWVSGTTSNISAYDRQGHAANRTLNRKGLKIYGMSYWPEDPDGYKLYIFDQPAVGLQMVHKMNTRTGDTLLARTIPTNNGEAPSGIFICNTYDVYSWVMMSMHNIAPANGSDRLSIWQLAARKEWMLVDPTAGVIQAGEHQDFDLHLNAAGLPAVEFRGELVFTHDGVHGETILPITLNVVAGPVHAERTLNMIQGWNLVSANLQPDEHDVTVLTQSLVDANQLVIMKDGAGNFYRPQSHFNNIPGWDVAQGYLFKVTEDVDLTLAGVTVMADDPIELQSGWQAVSYYPRRPIDATVALAGIADHLVIAKDGAGNFYIPSRHFSNMGDMVEGQGYLMKTDADVELVYQTGNRASMVSTGGTPVLPARYPSHTITGSNMSLLVEASGLEGDIGVYANNVLVGSGVLDRGLAGIAVWGDDPTTEAIDGAREGDVLELRLRDDNGERPLTVALEEGELTYHTDGLAIATVEASTLPSVLSLTSAYPNPFNSVTRIGFSLPEASKVSVRVFDVSGREVATLVNGQLTAGNHTAIWNAETASAGVYLVKMEGSVSTTKKLMLVK